MLPDVVFGCLRQVVPERVPAEGTSCLWNINVRGRVTGGEGGNYGFGMAITSNGGTGARPDKDGLSATAYPSGVRGTPVEIAETQTPLHLLAQGVPPRFRRRRPHARRPGPDHGDRERHRPSRSTCWRPSTASTIRRAAATAAATAQAGVVALKSGQTLKGKGFQLIPPGDRLMVLTPGGAGIGAPAERDRSAGRQRSGRRADLRGHGGEALRLQAAAGGRVSRGTGN